MISRPIADEITPGHVMLRQPTAATLNLYAEISRRIAEIFSPTGDSCVIGIIMCILILALTPRQLLLHRLERLLLVLYYPGRRTVPSVDICPQREGELKGTIYDFINCGMGR